MNSICKRTCISLHRLNTSSCFRIVMNHQMAKTLPELTTAKCANCAPNDAVRSSAHGKHRRGGEDRDWEMPPRCVHLGLYFESLLDICHTLPLRHLSSWVLAFCIKKSRPTRLFCVSNSFAVAELMGVRGGADKRTLLWPSTYRTICGSATAAAATMKRSDLVSCKK